MGIMQFHTQGAPRKVIQTPRRARDPLRGEHGRPADLHRRPRGCRATIRSHGGTAIRSGHWDGDTLVVETTGLRDDGWLDVFGTPLTDAAKITERFRRPSYGRMEIDVTIDDPKVYTKPWTVRVNQRIMPDQELLEFVCLENQRYGKR